MIRISSATATEKQLDQLQSLVLAGMLAAVVIILADAAAEKNVSFLGLSIETDAAYGIAALTFIFGALTFAQLCARLADLIRNADRTDGPAILGMLFSHQWTFNPFTYFGAHPVSFVHSSFGIGLLVFVWWLGLIALVLLWNRFSPKPGVFEHGLWYAYISAGFLSSASLAWVHYTILRNVRELAQTSGDKELIVLCTKLRGLFIVRWGIGVLFAAAGFFLFYQFTHIGI
jgi:hypothetical protein